LNTTEHVNQAKSNEAVAEYLDGSPYPDWRATALFYAAVHYVQAYFVSLNPPRRFKRHADRDDAIQSDTHISARWDDYRSLKDWSKQSRYSGVKPGANDFRDDIFPALNAIKKHLRAFLTQLR
jgi:hypothetical protein